MKYFILLLMIALTSCSSKWQPKYKFGQCVNNRHDSFFSLVCAGAIYRIERLGEDYDYIIDTYYLSVIKGCPSRFLIKEDYLVPVECPKDF
jgi:hypothetical protein